MRKIGHNYLTILLGCLAFAGAGISATGCEDVANAAGNLAEQCGLACPATGEGIAAGNFAISGQASIDGFFASVVNFDSKATLLSDNINKELATITGALGLEAGASAAQIKAAIVANYSLDANAGISIKAAPPKCQVSAKATLEATAKCDASVDPGSVSVECQGSCEAEVSASGEVNCGAEAEVVCTGTAPELACEGECSGSCEVAVSADGSCDGKCNGTCSGSTDSGGKCDGTCDGTCDIQMQAGATCEGKCKGECKWTPPDGKCSATVKAECKASGSAEAKVECKGSCSGEVTPPKASAECEASAKADAELSAECTPPQLEIAYEFSASASADVKAEFEAFLVVFTKAYGNILAEIKRADIVLKAGANIGAAAQGAVTASIEASVSGDISFKQSVLLPCAIEELKVVPGLITAATTKLQGSVSAAGSLTAELGG
jgi:hypothetical protein